MIITNKKNLPEPMVNFVKRDGYQPAMDRISVTDLSKGIREIWLYKRHYNEIEQDVADMVWLMFGTALHNVIERAEEAGHQIIEGALEEKIGGLTLLSLIHI